MGDAHQPLSLAFLALGLVLAVGLASGCGSSDQPAPSETSRGGGPPAPIGASVRGCEGGVRSLRVTGVGCAAGHHVAAAWGVEGACATPPGSARSACTVAGYRCLAVATERGLSVDCSRPGRSISFRARRR